MERIEYRDAVDKSKWEQGEWHQEPDKIQWLDEATGLPCLIVRGPGGNLCGYVGVTPPNPLYGVPYGKCPIKCGDDWCDHRPDSFLEVHGGITFSHSCAEIDRAAWIKAKDFIHSDKQAAEAAQYPIGDAANRIKDWSKWECDKYENWVKRAEATSICHKPDNEESDCVWWFGFDCAHAGDFCPAFDGRLGRLGTPTGWGSTVQYRNIEYVAEQCRELARQLVETKQ